MLKYFLILFSLSLAACTANKPPQSNTTTNTVEAEKDISLEGTWELTRINDSYDGEWKDASESQKQITFEQGKYTEQDKWNEGCKGNYTRKDNSLSITHSCNQSALQYSIEELTSSRLLLSIQGRHGKVFNEYSKK